MRIICGYNVNLDMVCTLTGGDVRRCIVEHGLVEQVLERLESPVEGSIHSVVDFFSGLLLHMRSGSGGEWLVFNREVVDFLKEHFMHRSRIILGGNAGNMANVLAELGAGLVVPNIASHSRHQAELFSREGIRIPVRKRGELVLMHPLDASFENDEVIHFVFDYARGTRLSLDGLSFTVPRDDRFIATYDPVNIALTVNPCFEDYCRRSAASFDGALLAGFHLLLREYPDGTTYRDKIHRFAEHTECWKQHNPDMFIHVELGYFHSDAVGSCMLESLGYVDSLGMNEVELSRCALIRDNRDNLELRGGIEGLVVRDIIRGAREVLEATGVNRVCIHTAEFIVSVFNRALLDPGVEVEALDFGARTAAARAATGRCGDRRYIWETTRNMPRSRVGVEQIEELQQQYPVVDCGCGVCLEKGKHCICVVPATRCEKPLTTVGLGDTFTAATFLRELELTAQKKKNMSHESFISLRVSLRTLSCPGIF